MFSLEKGRSVVTSLCLASDPEYPPLNAALNEDYTRMYRAEAN